MTKRSAEPLERVHLWLYKDDVEWLRQTFDKTKGGMGFSDAARLMINRFHKQAQTKAERSARAVVEVPMEGILRGDI